MQRTARIMQGLLGIITALGGYLTYLHYTGGVAACPTTPLINCTRVLTSGGSVRPRLAASGMGGVVGPRRMGAAPPLGSLGLARRGGMNSRFRRSASGVRECRWASSGR